MRQSLFLCLVCAVAIFRCTAEAGSGASVAPVGSEIAQINICAAGQWFIIVNNGHCEIHAGVTTNPSWIGYISVDDYSRLRSRQATAASLSEGAWLITLGDEKLASELTNSEGNGAAADSSAALCLPQLPKHTNQGARPAIQIAGCNGALVNRDPWDQASQRSPRSGLTTIVRLLVANHLAVPIERVELQCELIKDLGADQLDTVELVMLFEETFSIEIREKDAERIVTVQDLVNYLVSKICR